MEIFTNVGDHLMYLGHYTGCENTESLLSSSEDNDDVMVLDYLPYFESESED